MATSTSTRERVMDGHLREGDVAITHHAIRRYFQRIERCSKRDAVDRLVHAATIARPPSPLQMRWASSRGDGRRDRCWSYGCCLWCPIEGLFLCCERKGDPRGRLVVVTVFRIPSDDEIRQIKAERQQSRPGRWHERYEPDSCTN